MNTKECKNAQEICIENYDGMYLVVAGPGVGKTYTVVKRIQSMIEKGIEANRILCLTFSDTAAREMKSRIGENNEVDVFTYHSFCLSIMEEFAEYFNSYTPNIITDSHKRTLINECIDEIQPVAYNNEKNNPYSFVGDILDGIEEIKKNRITTKEIFYSNLEKNPAWIPHLKSLQDEQKLNPTKGRLLEIKLLSDKIEKMKELWSFYELYNSKMRELNYIDFYDMINIVLKNFEIPSSPLLELVSKKYDYVIVDEYQDTNTAQNDIVFNLAKYINNVFVVGDDDQIIYTFQGAHLDTVEKFLNNFDNKVKVLCFDKNYRSTQSILDFSGHLAQLQDSGFYEFMSKKSKISASEKKAYLTTPPPKLRFISKCNIKDDNGNLLTKKLVSANEEIQKLDKPVEFIEFTSPDDERDYIVQKIVSLKDKIEKLSEIAILARTNRELKDYAIYLKVNGISTEITGGKNIFEINSVNVFITYLQFLVNPEKYSDKLLSFLLLKPFQIKPQDYKTIIEKIPFHKSLIDTVNYILDKGLSADSIKQKLNELIETYNGDSVSSIKKLTENKEIAIYDKDKLENFVNTFNYLQEYISSENYKNALLEIGKCTGIFEYYFNQDTINKLENIKGIKKLISEADSYFEIHKNQGGSFKLFVDYLTNLIEGGIEIRLDKEDKPLNAVQLSTYHSSKGREFEYVFMPALTKDRWESSKSSYKDIIPTKHNEGEDYKDIVENENRAKFLDNIKLLYVGMTRAKHSLTLSYAKTGVRTYGEVSWFIDKIVNDDSINENKIILKKLKNLELSSDYNVPKYHYSYNQEFKEFITSKLPEKFSVSALNTYRNCPKQYLYKYILEIKSDSGSVDDASFGTAMHYAFEYTIKNAMDNKKYPSAEAAYEVFCSKLDTLSADYPDSLKESAKNHIFSKNGYYDKFISLVGTETLDPNKKYEKKPLLDNVPSGYNTIYAEYPLSYEMEIPEEWGLNLNNKKVVLNGYIDRLDKNKNGEYYIYDYKSKESCENITPSDNYFYQMVFYKYVFELQNPNCKITNTTFLLPLEKNGNHEINVFDKFEKFVGDSPKNNFDTKVEELLNCIKEIYNLNFDVPKKPACTFCPYKQFCMTKTI